jgi:hypothetical protein
MNTLASHRAMTTVASAHHLSTAHAASGVGGSVLVVILLIVFVGVMVRATRSMGTVMSILLGEMKHVAAAMASTMLGVVLAVVVVVALLAH